MKIILAENNNMGHHKIYQDTLKSIENTRVLNNITNIIDVKKNPIKAYWQRRNFIKFIHSNCEKNDIIHFLYLDNIYKCPLIYSSFSKKKSYIGTLHWIPEDKFRIKMLQKVSKRLKYIVVHSEFLKERLLSYKIKNVVVIEYPSFLKRYEYKGNNDKIIISCLGGTRNDKGLDVLMDSFKYIKDSVKDKITFNICGIEQDIKFDDIKKESQKYNINVILKNKFLSDEEYEEEVIKSDVILLPYKKCFAGNSGPMTDGIYANKFIVGPKEGNLGYLIKRECLGEVFEQENSIDLAKKISELPFRELKKDHKFREKLTEKNFTGSYMKLYTNIKSNINL